MNYDNMGVRDLVREIAREESLAHDCGVTGDDWTTLKELDSALRRRVVKDASVGTITNIRTDWHIIGHYPPDGIFDLILHKETL